MTEALTKQQIRELVQDIEEGISIIVRKNHYYWLDNSHDPLVKACEMALACMSGTPGNDRTLRAALRLAGDQP